MLHNKHNFDIFREGRKDPKYVDYYRLIDSKKFTTLAELNEFEAMQDKQLKLPNGKTITFNEEQYEGIKKIREWLKNDKTFFVLAGYSGSGKSTLIRKILNEYRGGVVVSAPTHAAKRVIMEMTGIKGITLSGLLGLRPDISYELFDPNNPTFAPIAVPKISDYNLVIIDEASMINSALYNLILEKTLDTKTKVIFVGDPAQIPPINEKISIVFVQTEFDVHWLTKVERQKDTNPLILVYDKLRNNLDKIDGGFERKTNVNSNGEGIIFTTDKNEFRQMMIEKFKSDEYQKDTNYVKVIAWRNETVMRSNQIIRDEIIGKNVDVVEVNDLLTGYKTVVSQNMKFNIIENSADYRVYKKSKLEENSYGILGYRVTLAENLTHNDIKYQNVFIIDTNNYDNLHLYAEMHDFFKDTAKNNKKFWPKYYEFRRCNLLMVDIDKWKNGQNRETGHIISKELTYGYGVTCHKTQGATYQNVMILESDINMNWVIEDRNRLKYVSFSRPTILATVLTTKLD